MSYLNINFSTLEDAWGSNFEKSKKKKSNPTCNLYNKRNLKTHKPYKTVVESSHIRPIYEDEDYVKYYGYNDGRPYSRNANKLGKYKLQFPYKKPVVSNKYDDDEEEEEEYIENEEEYIENEEEYIENEEFYEETYNPVKPIIKVKKSVKKQQPTPSKFMKTSFSYIDEEDDSNPTMITKRPIVMEEDDYGAYTTHLRKKVHPTFKKPSVSRLVQEDDSDDEFESYLVKEKSLIEEEEDQYTKILKSVYEEMEVKPNKNNRKKAYEEEEETEEDFAYVVPRKRRNDRVYMDLMLYTISGIILIFIMEQFIQIGMKIKTPII